MKTIYLILLFLVINFGGLALGSWLMDGGSTGDWYNALNKAPWTPPGWVFGAAWTIIMICFSWYLGVLFKINGSPYVVSLFVFQVFLNVSWNWFFFNLHWVNVGLIIIILLTALIFYYFFTFKTDRMATTRLLLLPYMIWLCIATSLNLYVVVHN